MSQDIILQKFDNARLGKFHLTLMLLTGFCWLLGAYGVTIIGFMLSSMRTEWQVSASALGLMAGAGMIGMLIGSIVSGSLSDHFGRRNTLAWGLLYLGIIFLVSAQAWNYNSLLVLRLLTGMGLGSILPVSSTLVTEFSPSKYRGAMVVLLNACFGLGGTMAALAGYGIILKYGWRPAMLIGGLALIISPLVRLMLPESMRFLLGKGKVAEAQKEFSRVHLLPGVSPASTITAIQSPLVSTDKQSRGIWSERYARITFPLWFLWIAMNFLYQGAFIWLPTLLASTQNSDSHSFLLTMLISFGQLPGTLIVAYLADRMSRKRLMIASLALLCGVTFLFGVSQKDVWVLITGFLLMVFNGMAWGMAYPFSSELYPTRMRGSATGWATGIGRLGGVVAPIIVGWVIQAGGSLFTVFALLALAPFLSTLVLFTIKSETTGRSLEEISS
jgi:MFS transporter, putative metabolite:H+ symporter